MLVLKRVNPPGIANFRLTRTVFVELLDVETDRWEQRGRSAKCL